MARSSLLKAPRKKKNPRISNVAKIEGLGPEPTWDGSEDWDEEKLKVEKIRALNWYHYAHKAADLKKNLYAWMKEAEYSAADIKAVTANPDSMLTNVIVANATMLLNGMPNTESEWLRERVAAMIASGAAINKEKKVEAKKKAAPTMSIQDRMREQLIEIIAEIEEWEDGVYTDPKFEAPDVLGWAKSTEMAQAHINKIIDYYKPRLDEVNAVSAKGADDALKEAYGDYKKAELKRVVVFYDNLIDGLEAYFKFKQVNRKTRTKKAPTAQKLVAKMKFKKDDKDLKLVSVKPTDIVGASTVWVYNCKTRKIGVYHVDPLAGQLSVKGTTIVGFDAKTSVAKTLRKPEEKLKEFDKAGKVKLRTFLDDIKAVEVKLNGRINADTILLKAF